MERVYYQTPDGRLIPAATSSHDHNKDDTHEHQPGPEDEEVEQVMNQVGHQDDQPNPRILWQQQLESNGYALCPNEACGLAYLTLGGIAGHFKSCSSDDGAQASISSVDCPVCSVKFGTYTSMSTHLANAHYSAAAARAEEYEQELWSPQPGTSKQASDAASRQEQYLPHSVLDELDNAPSQSSESPAAQAARIMAESRKISYVRRPGRPRKVRRTPPPPQKSMLQYSDPFDIMKDPQIQQQLVLNHVPLPQEPQIVFQQQPQQAGVLRIPTRVMSLDGQPQRKRSRVDADSSTSDGDQQQQQHHYVVVAPVEGQASMPAVRVMNRSASASAPSDNATQEVGTKSGDEGGVTDESDFEERERKLAEEEEKLAEYERLVLQSERVAATESRKAKIREREKMVMRKKEELRKRLANAVQTIEAIKTEHVDIADDEEVVQGQDVVPAVTNEGASNDEAASEEEDGARVEPRENNEQEEEVLPDLPSAQVPASAEGELILPLTVASEELLQQSQPVANVEEEQPQREEEVVIQGQQQQEQEAENSSQNDGGGGEVILSTTDEGAAVNDSISAEEGDGGDALVSTEG